MRAIGLLTAVVLLATPLVAQTTVESPKVSPSTEFEKALVVSPQAGVELSDDKCRKRSTCCKVCSKGKACGDTCIRRDYNCKKGRGCACNAEELCPDGGLFGAGEDGAPEARKGEQWMSCAEDRQDHNSPGP